MNKLLATKPLVLLVVNVLLAGCPLCASADFYRYYDEHGGITITNEYKSIPERYREKVTVFTDKELENRSAPRRTPSQSAKNGRLQNQRPQTSTDTPARDLRSVTQPPSPLKNPESSTSPMGTSGNDWLSRQLPLLKIMGIVALGIAGLTFVGKLISTLAPRPLAIVIRITLFVTLAVYLFKGYSAQMAAVFTKVQNDRNAAQKAVDARSEKIRQQAE